MRAGRCRRLQATHKVYFTDLKADLARERFREFCALWNERKLPARLYAGVVISGRR